LPVRFGGGLLEKESKDYKESQDHLARSLPNYWHAVALVNMGKVEDSLPLFRRVFAMDKNWATLVPRLVKSGLLPDDPKLIERIVKLGGDGK
jgi:hypothetical protein